MCRQEPKVGHNFFSDFKSLHETMIRFALLRLQPLPVPPASVP